MKNLLVIFLFLTSNLFAQTTADPAYANMQRSVGGIVNKHVNANGYASADPKTYQTLKGIGTAAVSAVAGAGAGILIAGTSVAWGTVLAVAVVGSVISYGVSLGLDQLSKWIFGTGATPITTVPVPVNYTGNLIAGTSAFCDSNTCGASLDQYSAYQFNQLCSSSLSLGYKCWAVNAPATNCAATGNGIQRICIMKNVQVSTGFPASSDFLLADLRVGLNPSTVTCLVGQVSVNNVCTSIQPLATTPVSITTAKNNLTASDLQQPVDYSTMALLINKLWKDASSQSGYQGIPYDASKPVTTQTVQSFAQENPSVYPTVSNLLSPIGTVGSTAVTTGLAPSTTYNINQPVVTATLTNSPTTTTLAPPSATTDLGVDPNIRFVAPETPTAQSILDPILNMLPGWRGATFTSNGTCPKPVISFAPFMSLTVTMTSHCDLLEANRALIASIMSGVWLLIAALIVLGA